MSGMDLTRWEKFAMAEHAIAEIRALMPKEWEGQNLVWCVRQLVAADRSPFANSKPAAPATGKQTPDATAQADATDLAEALVKACDKLNEKAATIAAVTAENAELAKALIEIREGGNGEEIAEQTLSCRAARLKEGCKV